MRTWVSSPSIEWNSYVYLMEHMDIPTEWFDLNGIHKQFTRYIFYFTFFLLWTEILPFLCMMVKFGSIRHLCEHGTDILFTSAFRMVELFRFIQICLHGTNKKSIVFSPLLFSGVQSINQSIHMNIFFALRMFREMRYRPYCCVIHQALLLHLFGLYIITWSWAHQKKVLKASIPIAQMMTKLGVNNHKVKILNTNIYYWSKCLSSVFRGESINHMISSKYPKRELCSKSRFVISVCEWNEMREHMEESHFWNH